MATAQLSRDQGLTTCILPNLPHLNYSMARTKLTPKKGERGGEKSVVIKNCENDIGRERKKAPSPDHPHPQLKRFHQGQRRWRSEWRRQGSWRGWGGHHHGCPPDSWSRWLCRLDILSQVGRNLLTRSSDLLWEAKPP